MPFKKGQSGFKGRKHTESAKIKVGLKSLGNTHRLGIPQSLDARTKISKYMKGKHHQDHGLTVRRILAECVELEKQGFRAVPTGWKVIPDIIAVKDNKIYAVEVEYGRPNYAKYTQEVTAMYDDVIWILRKPIKESA